MKFRKAFITQEGPLIIAHRGDSEHAPENTLAAFESARRMGCRAIELDVHRCASGELVVFHDDTMERIAGHPGNVKKMTLAEIREFDIGSWKAPEFARERVPTLEEVLETVGPDILVDIELKTRTMNSGDLESKVSGLIKRTNRESTVILSSFNPAALINCKKLLPGTPTAIIWGNAPDLPFPLRSGLGYWLARADILKPDCRRLKGLNAFTVAQNRCPVLPWPVDDVDAGEDFIKKGASGIITNRPLHYSKYFS